MRERRRIRRLGASLVTLFLHPELPSCADCQRWVYDPKTWRRAKRRGEWVEREEGEPSPCDLCPKAREEVPAGAGAGAGQEEGESPAGTGRKVPNPEADPDARTFQALDYYRRCEVDPGGQHTPRDAIVVRNNAVIRSIELATLRAQARASDGQQLAAALSLLSAGMGRR